MGYRYTRRDLDGIAARLNRMTGVPEEEEERREPTAQESAAGIVAPSTVGRYYFSGAYGGWELVQTVSAGGGVRSVLRTGHVPARLAALTAYAYADGLAAAMLPEERTVRPEAEAGAGRIRRRAAESLAADERRVAAIRAARLAAEVEA